MKRQNHHGQRSNARSSGFWWIKKLFRNFPKRSGPIKTNEAVPEKQTIIFFWPKWHKLFSLPPPDSFDFASYFHWKINKILFSPLFVWWHVGFSMKLGIESYNAAFYHEFLSIFKEPLWIRYIFSLKSLLDRGEILNVIKLKIWLLITIKYGFVCLKTCICYM